MDKEKQIHKKFISILNSNNVEMLNEFIDTYGLNYKINGSTPLFWAVYNNKVEMIKRLLELGANPNDKNEMKISCLSLACYFGFVKVTKLLINYGAEIDFDCIDRAYFGWDNHVQVKILKVLKQYGWINLYLDDLRDIPEGFVGTRTAEEALKLIQNNKVHILSLDHDLETNEKGELRKTGYDLVKWICEMKIRPANKIFIHSDNIVGKENMYETLLAAQRRGFIDEDIKILPYPIVKNKYSGGY